MSERPIDKSDITLAARVVGGFRMVDAGEADDKIIAVLKSDAIWGEATSLADLPPALIERLRHYFLTYKLVPGQSQRVTIHEVYDASVAHRVVEAAIADHAEEYG